MATPGVVNKRRRMEKGMSHGFIVGVAMSYFRDAANEIMEKDRETEMGKDREGEKEREEERGRRERGGEQREETGTHKLRNSRNVQTAPHDSSMKNSTQLSPHLMLIISVNSKRIRQGRAGCPQRENHRPRPNH